MYSDILRESYKKHGVLHHACLIEGNKETVVENLITFFENELSFKTKGNPDFHYMEFDAFGVDDGRLLQGRAGQKALSERKIFVATFNAMTHEAQNALLKLFEEPTVGTHFFLVTPNIDKLLLTLRSRMFLLKGEATLSKDISSEAKVFLSSSAKDRLKIVKNIVDEKDKALASTFLNALEEQVYFNKNKEMYLNSLTTIEDAKRFIQDRGSSVKLLLEHVALTLPKLS